MKTFIMDGAFTDETPAVGYMGWFPVRATARTPAIRAKVMLIARTSDSMGALASIASELPFDS
eukprot:4973024-Amphidinium_carterae.1